MKSFFIFGNHPKISLSELITTHPEISIEKFEGVYAIGFSHTTTNLQTIQKELGGCVKTGEVLEDISYSSGDLVISKLQERLLYHIKNSVKTDDKIHFGISSYAGNLMRTPMPPKRLADRIGLMMKKTLRNDYKVRYVSSQEVALSSVVVAKNHLLDENGFEFVLLWDIDGKTIHIGRTHTVQDFEQYSARDYGRPLRDDKSGMLPPKLARIMINLCATSEKKNAKLLDPFCGSGTVLQEALLLGYEHIIGTDVSPKAISDTQKNLQWLKDSFFKNSLATDPKIKIYQSAVEKLSVNIEKNSVDVVVTEGFLGPALYGNEKREDVANIIKGLEKIYLSAFKEFEKILARDGKLVIVFPILFQREALKIDDSIKKLGFIEINPFSTLRIKLHEKSELFYHREGQKLTRHIRIFQKK